MIYGIGTPPQSDFETKTIHCAINQDYTGTINFRNPFKEPISVNFFKIKYLKYF
jgi:hypothetical protein